MTIGPASRAIAQDASGATDGFCALFTADEVGAVLGTAVQAAPDSSGCSWSATSSGFTAATASWTESTLAQHKETWPGGEDLTVGGRPAYYSPGMLLDELLIETGSGVLYLVITGYDGDVRTAILELGDLAMQRTSSLPRPPEPEPAAQTDPVLESLFPASIGGEPLTITSMAGGSIGAEGAEALEGALAQQGKSIADLSIALASTPSGALILGFRVAGGDASAVSPSVFYSMFGSPDFDEAPGQVAGKDVTVLTVEGESVYVYPAGETIWYIDADEPALTEILGALP